MKNEKSHSSCLQQKMPNVIKPEFFYPDSIKQNQTQETIPINNETYPYINLHISFDNQNENKKYLSYFCTINIKYNGVWKELDRTEIKYVDHYEKHIKFTKFFTLPYIFQVIQQIKFCLYQQINDSNHNNENEISNQLTENFTELNESETYNILGECEISLSSIVLVSQTKEIQIPLQKVDQNEIISFLRIKPEQVDHCSSIVNGQIICEKLKKSRWASCNEPFFVISKKKTVFNPVSTVLQDNFIDLNSQAHNENNSEIFNSDFTPVYQSEINKKMQFKPFSIPYQVLCNMDKDIPIRISFYYQKKHKKPKIIGYNETTFSRLFQSIGQVLPVFHISNSASIVGSFKIVNLSVHHKSNLYDYLQSGIKLNYITVIDFTSLIKNDGENLTSHEELKTNSPKANENSNFSSTSSSSPPLSSSLFSIMQNDAVESDTDLTESSTVNSFHILPPSTKRKTRNSYMETKPKQIHSYNSSSSSSSPNLLTPSFENVNSSYSCANIETYHHLNNENYQHLTERCVRSVGEIISNYNSCNSYPTLGFGAEVDGKLKNCFPLSLNMNNPCVKGIDGIVNTFHEAIGNNKFKRCGPTLFSPVIKYASRYAIQSFEKNRSYSVLVILTVGNINDMQDTIDALVDASRLPLSIILVGIKDKSLPDSNFAVKNRIKSEMEILNSFNEKNSNSLKSSDENSNKNISQSSQLISRNGRKMERNVVKFVLFDESKSDEWNSAEILKDIPSQLVEWTEMNGIKSYST